MAAVTRSRRAAIVKEAGQIRMLCQRRGHGVERTVTAIRNGLPEVTALEAWRLALGWSRADTVAQIGGLYRADGLLPPGLSESMLCRWEHHPNERPGPEYAGMLCRVYGARPGQLGLSRSGDDLRDDPGWGPAIRYGRPDTDACAAPAREMVVPMTTAAGLPAVRESLRLTLLADPGGSDAVVESAEAAVEHYALNYSKHPPQTLFGEVHAARTLLSAGLTDGAAPEPVTAGMRRTVGWLSALLGNLAFHLDDPSGARAHLATATAYGTRTGDTRLTAWSYGAQSMVARAAGQLAVALAHAKHGLAHAPAGLARAQLHAWAQMPALAAQGQERETDAALAAAGRELEADSAGWAPGRFGFDAAEYALHEADAHLSLGRSHQAAARAEASLAACAPATPGWAAAALVLAQAEASLRPADAAQRALHVLEHVPAARLRSTARARLTRLNTLLASTPAAGVEDLHERVRTLPPPVDAQGHAASA